ncbi:MAG: MarR family transcriptional regulator [Sneathiella sp.]|nr:MAG: MarR family transcriptional regulator [Sneathiella sp.]
MPIKQNKLFLPRFLPYRVTKLSGVISRSLAGLYSERFNLTIQEWRIITILGSEGGMTARDIGELASLDKVNVSRAVDRLQKSGRLEKRAHKEDRRSAMLFLTAAGKKLLKEIIPLAQDYESRLLADFSSDEIEQLDGFLNKLDAKSDYLRDLVKATA